MEQIYELQTRDCLVWVIERPLWDVPRKSSNFWLQGYEWNFQMSMFSTPFKGYKIVLRKVADKLQLKTELTVTTFIRGQTGDTSLWNVASSCSAEQRVWLSHADSANKALGTDFHSGKWTVVFVFRSGQPLMLHLPRSEKDMSKDKCVQASSHIPPDLESLSGDFRQLLESEIFTDVKLRCGDRSISAHRSVLAARSDVFTAMFRHKMAESETGTVNVTDVDSVVFNLLLQYVYSGKIPNLSDDTARSLYAAGDKYAIHVLKKSCSNWMVRNLTTENCLGFLILAEVHSDEDFKRRVVDFAAENLESIKKDDWSQFDKKYTGLANSVYKMRFASALAKQA